MIAGIVEHNDDALWTGLGATQGQFLTARRHYEFVDFDVAAFIKGIKVSGYCFTTSMADTFGFVYYYSHDFLTYPSTVSHDNVLAAGRRLLEPAV